MTGEQAGGEQADHALAEDRHGFTGQRLPVPHQGDGGFQACQKESIAIVHILRDRHHRRKTEIHETGVGVEAEHPSAGPFCADLRA